MAQVNATATLWAIINGAWTQLNDVQPWRAEWGIRGNGPNDRVAEVGEMTFYLDNSGGEYTPGGPNAISGWRTGIYFRMIVVFENEVHIKFFGFIDDIQPVPSHRSKLIRVTALDWMEHASRHPIVNPGVLSNRRGDQVLSTIFSGMPYPPYATDLDTGTVTFPSVLDTVRSTTTAYNEFARVAFSELGYVYNRMDSGYGSVLTFEGADARYGWRAPGSMPLAADDSDNAINEDGNNVINEDGNNCVNNDIGQLTFGGAVTNVPLTDYSAPYGEHVINRMSVFAYPRKVDTSDVVLFDLNEPIAIASGASHTLKGYWANPEGGLPISAQNVITPVITTDYLANTAEDGSGTDISADLVLTSWTAGTEGFTAVITNNNANVMCVTRFSPRGRGIYIHNPTEATATDSLSALRYGTKSETMHQKYQNTTYSGRAFAESQVAEYKDPRSTLDTISFTANRSSAAMTAFLNTDIGDLRYIQIGEIGINGNYYVQGIQVEMTSGIIRVTWTVRASLSMRSFGGLSPMAIEIDATQKQAVDFGPLPRVYSDSTTALTITGWGYWNGGGTIACFATEWGGLSLYTYVPGNVQLRLYHGLFDVGQGRWRSGDIVGIAGGNWYHFAVTMSLSSPTDDPVFYFNGSATSTTELETPSGSAVSRTGLPLILGNWKTSTDDYIVPWGGRLFDVRIYDRILSASEISQIYNGGTISALVGPWDMTFQAFTVREEDYASLTDATLSSANKFFDAQYKAVGTVIGTPIARAAP